MSTPKPTLDLDDRSRDRSRTELSIIAAARAVLVEKGFGGWGVNAIARAAPNTNYGASARTEFTPTRIWDDGTFTYFAFPRNAPVPAIFRYTNGRERTVNTGAVEDGVIRVSGVGRQWVLRLGEDVVCIEANPPAEAAS